MMLNLLTPMPATPDISMLTVKQPTLEQLSTNKDVLYPGQRKISGQRANGLAELIAQQDPELENIPSPNNVSEYKERLSQAKANIELSINFINDSKIENNENLNQIKEQLGENLTKLEKVESVIENSALPSNDLKVHTGDVKSSSLVLYSNLMQLVAVLKLPFAEGREGERKELTNVFLRNINNQITKINSSLDSIIEGPTYPDNPRNFLQELPGRVHNNQF